MGDVVRFPQERCPGSFADTYRSEPAVILVLPVVRVDRDDAEGPAPALRRRRRRVPPEGGLLSPGTEARVRAAFERLRQGDVSMAGPHGPTLGVGPILIGPDPGPVGFGDFSLFWPGGRDTGDESD